MKIIQKLKDKINWWIENTLSKALVDAQARMDYEKELIKRSRWGDPKAIAERLARVKDWYRIGSLRVREREYQDNVFVLEGPEGATLDSIKPIIFTGFSKTGSYRKQALGIRFFAKVVGFEDDNAPSRNWGVGIESFDKSSRGGKK